MSMASLSGSASPSRLSCLLSETLPTLLQEQKALETAQQSYAAVDGVIVGTGRADFTQSNVAYHFQCEGKPFQLLDVPGIEGDESKYEQMVFQAIAKAHLVFYVNGTNKKPEANTIEKIWNYLNRDGKVCAICNVRGLADAYEFDKDRVALDQTHKDAATTRQQTRATLETLLGVDLVTDCISVQGLLAFSGLARTEEGLSSISQDRPDLRKAQRAYGRDFASSEDMCRFSQIGEVENLIQRSTATFDVGIVESNKRKIIRLIDGTVAKIESQLTEQDSLNLNIRKEIQVCKTTLGDDVRRLQAAFKHRCEIRVNSFFNALSEGAMDAVQQAQGEKNIIEGKVKHLLQIEQKKLVDDMNAIEEKVSHDLSDLVDEAMRRLQMEIRRLRIEQGLIRLSSTSLNLSDALDGLEFTSRDFGSILKNIASWVIAGAGIGNVIGAVLGAIIGAIVSTIKYFFLGKSAKIRDVQAKIHESIEEQRTMAVKKMSDQLTVISQKITDHVQENVLNFLDGEIKQMSEVSAIMTQRIASLKSHRARVGAMGHGKF